MGAGVGVGEVAMGKVAEQSSKHDKALTVAITLMTGTSNIISKNPQL